MHLPFLLPPAPPTRPAAIARGRTVPLVWSSGSPTDTLAAYGRMYLREEIQAEALVRNLPGFARFLPVAALLHGQVVNIAGLARDAGVARTTVEGYLAILEDTLIAFRLPGFEARLRVRHRGPCHEVDFILRRGREYLAIETTAARRWSTADLTGLRAVGELRGLVRRILVCRAERRVRTAEGIDVLSVAAFLDDLASNGLWP